MVENGGMVAIGEAGGGVGVASGPEVGGRVGAGGRVATGGDVRGCSGAKTL